ncbi:MAG: Cupin 2 conserved barrel domain protein [Gammaproteobacteria bacterium]|jgi:quercetin dioxygenase-like cupin family protein|nr:Cupin 2 conserved barrel domain protein [Gammaproteobacteria bacterium]
MNKNFDRVPGARLITGIALVALGLTAGICAYAQPPKDGASATPLLRKDLSGLPNKEVVALTVEYLPGGASLPHRHDADVFGYILAGHLIVQVSGHDPITLGPGQTFTESPDDIHLQSANASATEPAKFLAFIVKDKDKPVSRPVVLPSAAHPSNAPKP